MKAKISKKSLLILLVCHAGFLAVYSIIFLVFLAFRSDRPEELIGCYIHLDGLDRVDNRKHLYPKSRWFPTPEKIMKGEVKSWSGRTDIRESYDYLILYRNGDAEWNNSSDKRLIKGEWDYDGGVIFSFFGPGSIFRDHTQSFSISGPNLLLNGSELGKYYFQKDFPPELASETFPLANFARLARVGSPRRWRLGFSLIGTRTGRKAIASPTRTANQS